MSGHLEDGLALSNLGEWHMLFNLLWQFVQPDRREQCQAALGVERFRGFLPLAIDACIVLSEWEITEDLCALGADALTPTQLAYWQGAIHKNIGSLANAERVLRLGIEGAGLSDKLALEPELANVLRLQGKLRDAWRLLRDWIRYRPRTLDELVAWIQSWRDVADCSAWLWSRVDAGIAERFLNARDKAAPVFPAYVADARASLEWAQLCFVARERRTSDQWLRMLELARILGDDAARMSRKEADGGWMIGILESLNGLEKHQDALNNVPVIVSQLHEYSFYRPWVDIEASRAHQGLGQSHLARELAGRALKQALASRQVLMAHSAAALLLELPNVPAPSGSETLARQLVEAVRNDTPSDREFQLDVPLPGENGWSDHLAVLLAECVSDAPNRIWGPRQREIPAAVVSAFDSALRLAAEWGLSAAVPTILARGGRALFGDNLEQSPLMLAVKGGHTEVVRALLEKFGRLNLRDAVQGDIALSAIKQAILKLPHSS